MFTSIHLLKALTTLAPTPWSPPDTLYPPLSNFPPAWRTVYITSGVDFPLACFPTGTPRPSSSTVILLSSLIVTFIFLPKPKVEKF